MRERESFHLEIGLGKREKKTKEERNPSLSLSSPHRLPSGQELVEDLGPDVPGEALVSVLGEQGEQRRGAARGGGGRCRRRRRRRLLLLLLRRSFSSSFSLVCPLALVPPDFPAVEAVPPVVVRREHDLSAVREGEAGAGDAVGDAADDDAKVGEGAVLSLSRLLKISVAAEVLSFFD